MGRERALLLVSFARSAGILPALTLALWVNRYPRVSISKGIATADVSIRIVQLAVNPFTPSTGYVALMTDNPDDDFGVADDVPDDPEPTEGEEGEEGAEGGGDGSSGDQPPATAPDG